MTASAPQIDRAFAARERAPARVSPLLVGAVAMVWAAVLSTADHPLAAWVALVPSLALVARSSAAGAAALGAAAMTGPALLLVSWIPGVLVHGFALSWPSALGIWLAASFALAPAGAAVGLCARRLAMRPLGYGLGVGAAWFLAELSCAMVLPGIGWVVLGAAQLGSPAAPLAAIAGVHGVSGAVAAGNAVIACALFGPNRRAAAIAGAALVAVLAGSHLVAPDSSAKSTPLRVALIQPGLPMPEPGESVFFEHRQLEKLAALTSQVGEVDWVVWPEGSALESLDGRPDLVTRIQRAADQAHARILLGAPRFTEGKRWSSIFRFAPNAEPRAVYDKQIPVPLVEHMPAWARALPFVRRDLVEFGAAIEPGRGLAPARDAGIGAELFDFAICFEAAYSGPGDRPNAVALVNVTNDGWYDRTPAAAQHLRLARWRAVERGAHLLRATATGTTAAVSPRGEIIEQIGVGDSGALVTSIEARSVVTPFEQVGYAPTAFAAALALAFLLTTSTPRTNPRSTCTS